MLARVACLAVVVLTILVSSVAAQSSIDVNADGVADILLQDSASGAVAAWLMNHDGRPTQFVPVDSAARGVWSVATTFCNLNCSTRNDDGPWTVVGMRDVTFDGVADILLQSPVGTVMAWVMTSAGQVTRAAKVADPFSYCFGDSTCYNDARWRLVALADLDNDGLSDLVFQSPLWEPGHFGGAGGVRVLLLDPLGRSKSWFRDIVQYDMGGWQVAGAADVNHDAIPDLLLQHPNGHVAAWLVDGSGRPAQFVWVFPAETGGWQVVGTFDLDEDGTLDIVLQYPAGHVAVWIMSQTGQPIDFVFIWPYEAGRWRVVGR